eukprot:gene66134-90493_t
MIINLALFGAAGLAVWAVQMAWIPVTAAGIINGIGHYWGYRNFEAQDASTNLSPWGMFMGADIVVKVVMTGLAVASLVTWTVWLAKTVELARETRSARRRLNILESDTTLAQVERESADAHDPVAQLIHSAVRETALSHGLFDDGFKERIALRLERVEHAMSRRISRSIGIVATIGATAPFVGLFGTVWGIMNAFIGISEAHTTNLAVVAPGI